MSILLPMSGSRCRHQLPPPHAPWGLRRGGTGWIPAGLWTWSDVRRRQAWWESVCRQGRVCTAEMTPAAAGGRAAGKERRKTSSMWWGTRLGPPHRQPSSASPPPPPAVSWLWLCGSGTRSSPGSQRGTAPRRTRPARQWTGTASCGTSSPEPAAGPLWRACGAYGRSCVSSTDTPLDFPLQRIVSNKTQLGVDHLWLWTYIWNTIVCRVGSERGLFNTLKAK